MTLTFLGTRGYVDARNRRHRMHASLLVEDDGVRTMIDCGEDWLGRIGDVAPDAIVLTHAHPDHAYGLHGGAPCPLHATEAAWTTIDAYPVEDRVVVRPREPFRIGDVRFEYFPVEHSTRAPAGGYRIDAGRASLVYVPDVVYVHDR